MQNTEKVLSSLLLFSMTYSHLGRGGGMYIYCICCTVHTVTTHEYGARHRRVPQYVCIYKYHFEAEIVISTHLGRIPKYIYVYES